VVSNLFNLSVKTTVSSSSRLAFIFCRQALLPFH
jgi:hypothetical protein